jgi:hypothetical protein
VKKPASAASKDVPFVEPDDHVNDEIDAAYHAKYDRHSRPLLRSDGRPGTASGDDQAGAALTSTASPSARVSRSLSLRLPHTRAT